jgi:alpha-N-acetylglucosaminidase
MYYKKRSPLVKLTVCLLVVILLANTIAAQEFSSLQGLIARRVPALKSKISFLPIKSVGDSATYYTRNGKLYIKASSVSSAAYALNDYLKKYCNSSFSHTGDHIQIPAKLPATKKAVQLSATFPIRYALNYCTYNYTMSFWGWEEWEKELDWMALHGVNLMLAPIGTEEIWQSTLQEFGFSDEEIKQFLPGPAFNAWWLMGNLEGWGGPVSDNMIRHWTQLQQKILQRMKELGIEPVLQGFVGMVPTSLKRHFPYARIIEQGKWAGGFQRPPVLSPQDSLFAKMSSVYYKHMKTLYGDQIKYLGGDLFHEGGNTGNLDIEEVGRSIQSNMQKHFPNCTWVLQGWQGNPMPALLKGLNRSHTLILDLMGDRDENWNTRNGYDQFPWVWCTITNFGAKPILEGKLVRLLTEPMRANRSEAGKSLRGIGIIPEGIENNAIAYQWMLDMAWQKEPPSLHEWMSTYIRSRYGSIHSDVQKAWEFLLASAYMSNNKAYAGGYESILCARPDTNIIQSVTTWGPAELPYDSEILLQAALSFSKAAEQFKKSETYQYDLVDIWRQVIALEAWKAYHGFMVAFKQKNKTAFDEHKKRFIELLRLQNKWTGTVSAFRVGTWIEQAKNMKGLESERKLNEWNARTQITYWGPDNAATDLRDYAYKEWNGILNDLYFVRWLKFFEYAEAHMDGQDAIFPDFFAIEKQWAEANNSYAKAPEENCISMLPELVEIVLQNKK